MTTKGRKHERSVLAVVLGVVLARFASVMVGVRGMAVRRMGMVRGLLVMLRSVVLGRLTVVLGGMLMMLSRSVMMLDDLVLGHDALHPLCSDCESVAAS